MAEKSTVAVSPTFPSSCAATTSRAFRRSRPRLTTSSAKPWRCFTVATLELFGTAGCQYTQELREWLVWTRRDFIEYDVEADYEARKRMASFDSSLRTVPVLVEDGKVIQVGWQGRGCIVGSVL